MAAWDIDEKKLRSALPREDTSPWYSGLMYAGWILGCAALLIVSVVLIALSLLRALP